MAPTPLGALLHQIHRLASPARPGPRTDPELLAAFARRRDEAAFAALVARHGPLVLRVCRRVLGNHHDAEDAFQATFLVLAQRARSIRKREALAGWLHGVAYRTAMKAKRGAARRRHHEARVTPPASAAASPGWGEVQAALDEELGRLPERFRSAFVLRVLEGRSIAEAAAALRCKAATVSTRLSRARQLLRQRLVRRGIELSTLLAALAVAEGTGRAALPTALTEGAVRYGLLAAAGGTTAASIPAHVAGLATGVTRALFLSNARVVAAVLLAALLAVAGAGALAHRTLAGVKEEDKSQAAPEADVRPRAALAGKEQAQAVEVSGRVIDPDGRPVAAARLVFAHPSAEKVPDRVWATSGADGRFHFSVPRSIGDAPWEADDWDFSYVVAAAEGYGFAWAPVRSEAPGGLTLRLVKDDVPIRGRVLDLQGKPVAGATIRMEGVYEPKKGDLDDWFKAVKASPRHRASLGAADFTPLYGPAFAALLAPVTSGADGQFTFRGIGRERVVNLRLQGPTIATQWLTAVTRPVERFRLAADLGGPGGPPDTCYGPTFALVATPTRPVEGVVRDKDTGKPLAGITVQSRRIAGFEDINGEIRTTTDSEGRYRLVGLPKGKGNAILAEACGRAPRAGDQPYLAAVRPVVEAPGLEPARVDIALRRGTWVKGRVTDKATGKPVRAGLDYFCFANNPRAAELQLSRRVPSNLTGKDGSFRVVVLPGRGLIAVRVYQDKYRTAAGADRIKGKLKGSELFDTEPYRCNPGDYHTLVAVSAKPGEECIHCDIALDPGRSLPGVILGPDGKPLPGARISGLGPLGNWEDKPLKTAEFTVRGLAPEEVRTIQVYHEKKRLAGWLRVRGEEQGPVRLRLEPWGTLTGRLVTPGGQPVTGVSIFGASRDIRPDKDGRFRIDGLAAGRKYSLSVNKAGRVVEIVSQNARNLTVGSGETRDLGDIRVKPFE